jgi:hypothetical protein
LDPLSPEASASILEKVRSEKFCFPSFKRKYEAHKAQNDSESFLESNLFHVVSNFCYKRTAWSLDSQSF